MNRKKTTILTFLVTVVFLALILSQISLSNVVYGLRQVGAATIVLCFGLHLSVYALRALAFNTIVGKKGIFLYVLNSHLIHNFYLNIMPASMGELSLPYLLSEKIKPLESISAIVLSRMVMLVLMLILFIISTMSLFNDRIFNLESISLYIILLVFFAFIAVVLIKVFIGDKKCKWKLANKVLVFLRKGFCQFLISSKKLTSPTIASKVVLATLLYLVALTLFYQVLLIRLGLTISMVRIIFIMSIQAAILVLPIKSFGGFGTTEGSWMLGMMALGIDRDIALETGFIVHIVALLSAFFFFIIGIIWRSLALRDKIIVKSN